MGRGFWASLGDRGWQVMALFSYSQLLKTNGFVLVVHSDWWEGAAPWSVGWLILCTFHRFQKGSVVQMSGICDTSCLRRMSWGEFQCSEHLLYRVISYLLLHNKLPPNLVASNNIHDLSVSVGQESGCGLAGSSGSRCLTGCSHLRVLSGEEVLPRWLTWLLAASDPCWLLARDSSSWPRGPPHGAADLHQKQQERARNWEARVSLEPNLGMTSHHSAAFFSSEGSPQV